jgi:hypothetical protein
MLEKNLVAVKHTNGYLVELISLVNQLLKHIEERALPCPVIGLKWF